MLSNLGDPAPEQDTPLLTHVDRLAYARGCRYYPVVAERPVEFIERFCRPSEGKWASAPLKLMPWQKDFLRRLFGWLKPDGSRRYTRCYLELPKKSGKSVLISSLIPHFLLCDEMGPKIFINSLTQKQSRIIFDEAVAMIRSSPELLLRLKPLQSINRIVCEKRNGFCQSNSSEAPSQDGVSASVVIFDELHRQTNTDLWNMFEYSGAGRFSPIHISITTAGQDETGIWFAQRTYAERVNSGEIEDTSFLGIVYRADPEKDDLDDPATWYKCNPSLGITVRLDTFKSEYEKAKQSSSDLALFKRLRFGIIQKTEQRFLNMEDWEKCSRAPRTRQDLLGLPAWGGQDLSKNIDCTALITLHGTQAAGFDIHARFWIPEERIDYLEKRDRVPFRNWVAQGWVTATPGEIIDYDYIRLAILDIASVYDLRALASDPWNATGFANKLKEDDGINVVYLQQGFRSLSSPTKELEALVISSKLRHGNNPVLKWMAGNAVVVQDAAGNKKLSKEKSREAIDGISALVNALAVMAADPNPESSYESVYDHHGLQWA